MKVWAVLNGDEDLGEGEVTFYSSEDLAREHCAECGGTSYEGEVLDVPAWFVTDPDERNKRITELKKVREEWENHLRQEEEADRCFREIKPDPSRPMALCHCDIFSITPEWRVNEHGYCRYCGGFTWQTVRYQMGELALQTEIDRLSEPDRIKMRRLVAGGKP